MNNKISQTKGKVKKMNVNIDVVVSMLKTDEKMYLEFSEDNSILEETKYFFKGKAEGIHDCYRLLENIKEMLGKDYE